MTEILRFISGIWCQHSDVRRSASGRMWMECLNCGRQSVGIDIEPPLKQEEAHRDRLGVLVRIGDTRQAA